MGHPSLYSLLEAAEFLGVSEMVVKDFIDCGDLATVFGAVAGNFLPDSVASALGIAIYGMFLAIIIPPAKQNRAIVAVILLAVALSCLLQWAPVFAGLGSGFVIIICTLLAAAFAAWKFPVKEAEADE